MTRTSMPHPLLLSALRWAWHCERLPMWVRLRAKRRVMDAWAVRLETALRGVPRGRQETIRPPDITGPGGDA